MNSKLNLDYLKSDLSNNTEKLVIENMERLLTKDKYKNICKCKECLLDIASFALNRLPAKYIHNTSNDLYQKISEFENKVSMDVKSTVEKAIEVVSNNPRHN